MSRNAPHPSAAVEGYYSKFDLQDGSHIILVICSVRHAPSKRHMVSLTHYPSHGNEIWQRQYYDKDIDMRAVGANGDFELDIPTVGSMKYTSPGQWTYNLTLEDFFFSATTHGSTPWSPSQEISGAESSPESWLTNLPLPLHWHVSSLASPATYSLSPSPNSTAPRSVASAGQAVLHLEKNWGDSFPKNHVWMQVRGAGASGLCLAGGSILGVQAFLLGYRRGSRRSDSDSDSFSNSEKGTGDGEWDFRPPFALQVLGYSPFLSQRVDWPSRSVELDLSDFRRRILIRASAPRDSFFCIGAPFKEGHREGALAQSFRASIEVVRFRRRSWWGGWTELDRERFEEASLEFGGSHYGGSDKRE